MKVFTRVAGLLVLGAILLIGPTSTTAATPGSGTVGVAPADPSVSWSGGPYVVPTPVPDVCPPASDPLNVRCDHFYLTVNVPPTAHPAEVGKQVVGAIQAYEQTNGSRWRR